MRKIAILGSTGSIGTQTLQVISNHLDLFQVVSLVAYSNEQLLKAQAEQFCPKHCFVLKYDGENSLIEAVKEADMAVFALRGIVSLDAVLYCIRHNIDVALANKEVLVCAGPLVKEALKTSNSKLLPIDSEHSAIWQCLTSQAEKLLLTASGGPFYRLTKEQLKKVTPEQALKHPKWDMGAKITVDSSTLVNKAFEVIEAHYLFDVAPKDIEIVVHPQSIVHSMVQYKDGSVLAQLSHPDMRLPIQLALLQERAESLVQKLDFQQLLTLTFEPCNFDKFPLAKYGHKALEKPHLAVVLNAVNDVCVENFLIGKISYVELVEMVQKVVGEYENGSFNLNTTKEIFNLDKEVREKAQGYIK